MPRPTDHDQRRADIADALARIVAARGVGAVNVRAVAEELGATTGVVMHYFRGRDELLLHAFRMVSARAGARMRALAADPDPLAALGDALAEALPLDAERAVECALWFGFVGLAAGDDELRAAAAERYDRWEAFTAELLARAVDEGRVAPGTDIAGTAAAAMAMVDGLAVRASLDPERFPPARQRAHLEAWVGGLAAEGEGAQP